MSASHPHLLSESMVSLLRKEILSGQLEPGSQLSEARVAKRHGVSRVPVREALVTLASEGLVEYGPTGRAFVKTLRARDFEELYELRLLLEPSAARMAAVHVKSMEGMVQRFKENIRATEQASTEAEVTRLDLDFHELILEAAGNARLLRIWRSFRNELQLWLGSLHHLQNQTSHTTQSEVVALHSDLLQHFLTGTPATCERVLRDHILVWREWLPLGDSTPLCEVMP